MSDESWSTRERELQLFLGFDRKLLKSAMRDLIEDRIESLAERARLDVTEALDLEPNLAEIFRSNLDQITRSFKLNAREPLEIIDKALDEYLTIPDSVVLPGDEELEKEESVRSQLQEENSRLREKAISLAAGKQLLQRELVSVRSERLQRLVRSSSAEADQILDIPVPQAAGSAVEDFLKLFPLCESIKEEFLGSDSKSIMKCNNL